MTVVGIDVRKAMLDLAFNDAEKVEQAAARCNTSGSPFRAVLPTEGKKHTDKSNWNTDDPLGCVIGNQYDKQPTSQPGEREAETNSPVNQKINDPNDEVQES